MISGDEGTVFGKYLLLKKLAVGGMGEIFLAKLKGPVGFEKLLVIKRILAHHAENSAFVDMFFVEARIAAQLNHSNVVQIYEMGEIDDSYFIAMEYVHGKSLHDILERVRELGQYIPPAHIVEIIGKLCAGMSYAHNARDMSGMPLEIVHRDINPHNLLISYAGDIKVIDFGIAKSQMSMHQTESGTIKGKFVYMSPEQSAAEPLDKRSDIFSAGICLYEALTFSNPFAKPNVVLSLEAIQRSTPPPLSQSSPRWAPFQPVVDRALAKRRDYRYADFSEMRADLLALIELGQLQKAVQPLSEFMNDIFAEQITREKRMIVEADAAAASTGGAPPLMRYERDEDPTDIVLDDPSRKAAARPGATNSHRPFLVALVSIMLATLIGAVQAAHFGRVSGLAAAPREATPAPTPSPHPRATAEPESPTPGAEAAPPTIPANIPAPPPRLASKLVPLASDPSAPRIALEAPSPPAVVKPPSKSSRSGNKPRKPRPASKPAVPAAPTFGSFQMSTEPSVRVTRNGSSSRLNVSRLGSAKGVLGFGSGQDAEEDPFKITIEYSIDGGAISYAIKADPWAIVRNNGIGVGKTPLPMSKGTSRSVFEFVNPKEGRRLKVTVRFSAPRGS